MWAPTSASAFANGTGLLLNGIDGLQASNIGVFRYSKGVHTVATLPGLPYHPVWGSFTNVITDYCIEGFVTTGFHDITLATASLHSHETSLHVTGDPADGPDTGNSGGAHLRVSAADIKSNGAPAVVVDSAGETVLTIGSSTISRVFPPVTGVYALQVKGNATQAVTVTGCDIASSAPETVYVEGSAKPFTLITNNNVRGNVTRVRSTPRDAAWARRTAAAATRSSSGAFFARRG